MSETGWIIDIDFSGDTHRDGQVIDRITGIESSIASLPEAVAEALRDEGLASAFCGSFQITVRSGQLEQRGSDNKLLGQRCEPLIGKHFITGPNLKCQCGKSATARAVPPSR